MTPKGQGLYEGDILASEDVMASGQKPEEAAVPHGEQIAGEKPNPELKAWIREFCRERGADLVGFANVERWDEAGEVPPAFRPRALWPPARTVVVLGIEMPLPIVETTPSVLHMEAYRTCNRELDSLAFNLTRRLNRRGIAAYFFTRDGYGSLKALRDKPMAAFSHVMAGKYAGLGTIGLSHVLLTPEFGPRVRLISVFMAAAVEPDPLIEKDLCIKCGTCAECCPKQALTPREDQLIGDYNKMACLEMSEELTRQRCYPCGICTKVCPIGRDRLLYKEKGVIKKYREERKALQENPDDPRYRAWEHVRRYGRV